MKNPNYSIGNRIHGLPACSTVPQPTAQHTLEKCNVLKMSGTTRPLTRISEDLNSPLTTQFVCC